MKKQFIIQTILILFLLALPAGLTACASATTEDSEVPADISVLQDKRIGILTGTIYDSVTKEKLPDAEYLFYNNITDLTSALLTNKIDAFAEDETILREIEHTNGNIFILPEKVSSYDVGYIFAKNDHGQDLCSQFDVFLRQAKESGLTEELHEKWFHRDEDTSMLDYARLPADKGILTVATSGMSVPLSFVQNNIIVGYEVELIARFCEENGYGMQMMQMDFGGIISAVQSGRADMACSGIGITEERKEQVLFSEPTNVIDGYFAVRKDAANHASPISRIKDSFYNTFVKENRYRLFLQGILVTVMITLMSLLFGTALGFLVYSKARNNFNGVLSKVADFFIWLIHGMPMVVFLMILFYIVFGNTALSGFVVAVIAFSLSFACSMYSMLKSGEKAVDGGQSEAAFTLGFTRKEAFYQIVLPQAAIHFMPSYKAEIVSLIKATAVVGYIAVQDITKVGDIVRSRTYEAFFPLIVIAIMYFVMAAVMTAIVNKTDFIYDPAKKDLTKILKGVRQDD